MVEQLLRILLVDDDPHIRGHFGQLLSDELPGATIVEIGTAEDILPLIEREHWDVVLLDIRLPGKSGLAILPELKAVRPRLPVIMLSGLREVPYTAAALRAGASAFVPKDRASDDLLPTIRRLMDPSP